MKSLFTLNAGEFIAGTEIEKRVPGATVWAPSKDSGVDIIVSNSKGNRFVSLQVKLSADHSGIRVPPKLKKHFLTWSWWTYPLEKIEKSKADLWLFILSGFDHNTAEHFYEYILIPPRDLYKKISQIHGVKEKIHSYLCITENRKCWEVRGLSRKEEKEQIANNEYYNKNRDFTEYLNAWEYLTKKL